ncbi:Gfo/Idh/MocA family protein [Nostocoides sp.]|jgi:myo-inositol 2-dehydrogenase/D-chiro-inositol 1-dehydrogenase|uniref:Gfo/Idh/MocA family protein n=1 Tax=Nostocoides sp. TaxID=1917966 RepID=UPI002C6635B2|nr:Gfo/Idh/MocA family oxidoreductase [Tetrasphaera sp.]
MRIGLAGTGRIGAFHARTLRSLPGVDQLVVADIDAALAAQVATDLEVSAAGSIGELLDAQLDGFVITAGTAAHADLIEAALDRGIPTFCEKPVALDLGRTIALADLERRCEIPVHIGFQRRFDAGYRRTREAIAAGEIGFVHTIRAATMDQSPPHAAYLPTSGGLFRDCSVHDFDIIRFVTGREARTVYAVGANKGDPFFTEAGDVDTAAATLVLDDDTLVSVTATRYNGAGHDVRMEVHGSTGTLGVGHDTTLAITSAEEGIDWPPGPRHWSFMDRFLPAYVAELTAFVEVARGTTASPCTIADALAAFRIAEACARSMTSGQAVHLADIPGAALGRA